MEGTVRLEMSPSFSQRLVQEQTASDIPYEAHTQPVPQRSRSSRVTLIAGIAAVVAIIGLSFALAFSMAKNNTSSSDVTLNAIT